ncbi:MAG: ABC transporter substrate-binding protein [Deltaproteobacteria bacterium]|nr:ABC transporter substrate-binding protein [Deltaproteobacteria bacterium]
MLNKATISYIAALILSFLILQSCKNSNSKTLTICGNVKIEKGSTENNVNFFYTPLEDFFLSPLVHYDPSANKYRQIIVKEARPLEDGKVWDIELKDNVLFHDGTPLTADDVAFSIEKRKEMSANLGAIRQAKVLNKKSIGLSLNNPVSDISDILSCIYVYPSHIFRQEEAWRKTFLEKPLGSGPFKFKRWLKNGVEFTANEDYFEGRPRIDKIVYISEADENKRLSYLLEGTADIMSAPISSRTAGFVKRDPKFHINEFPFPYYSALFLNNRSEIFSDSRARKAVNMAVNRESLIAKGLDGAGIPAYSPFMKNMLPEGYNITPSSYGPKAALTLLKDAGWRDKNKDGILEKEGKRLRFRLYYLKGPEEFKLLADIISQQLYEIGIEVETLSLSYDEVDNKEKPSFEYDAFLNSKGSFYFESVWQTRSLYGDKTYNYSRYSNKEVDALFEQAKNIKKPDEIKRIYGRIDRVIHEDTPAVFLYAPLSYTAVNKRLKEAEGFNSTPYDIYKIKDWE